MTEVILMDTYAVVEPVLTIKDGKVFYDIVMGYNNFPADPAREYLPEAHKVYFPMTEYDAGSCQALIEHTDKGKETPDTDKAKWKIVRLAAYELTDEERKDLWDGVDSTE